MINFKIKYQLSKDVFILFCALNAFGYDDENNKKGMHPTRKKARAILKKNNWNQKYPYLKKIFKKTGHWYLIRALLKKDKNIKKIKTLNNYFVLNLEKFTKEPSVKKAWKDLRDFHLREVKKLFPLFKKETVRLIAFINRPPKGIKKIVFIVNLLDAYWRGYALKIGEIGYVVVGPGVEKHRGELMLHELLHLLAPALRLPRRVTAGRNRKRLTIIDYRNPSIINREYVVRSLNLYYQSAVLKMDISKIIKHEEKDFPYIRKVLAFVKTEKEKGRPYNYQSGL